jgi:hypothetical protein
LFRGISIVHAKLVDTSLPEALQRQGYVWVLEHVLGMQEALGSVLRQKTKQTKNPSDGAL